jgi:hypothetical protein
MASILKKPSILKAITDKLLNSWQTADRVARAKAVDTIEYEAEELDNIFAIIVLGAFIGIAAPPIQITLELLPVMEKEFETMLDKVSTAHDPLGDLFSVFSID